MSTRDEKDYIKIGESAIDAKTGKVIPAAVYYLELSEFLEPLNPPVGFEGFKSLNPADYFITSGDATQKTTYLAQVVWTYACEARKQLNKLKTKTDEQIKFEQACWQQAGAVKKLYNLLVKIRGDDVFLETEWEDQKLLCIPKNPRIKPNIDENTAT